MPPDGSVGRLMLGFESIGVNCEFGLVQRAAGIVPIGLFRFAVCPCAAATAAISARLKGIGSPEHTEVFLIGDRPEYMVRDTVYGFYRHTGEEKGRRSEAEVLTKQRLHLAFLAKKLDAELAAASKIFVIKRGIPPLTLEGVTGLALAIKAYGPGVLLWVDVEDALNPAGTVVWHGDNLLKGHIDRFAPTEAATEFSFGGWVAVCREARRAIG